MKKKRQEKVVKPGNGAAQVEGDIQQPSPNPVPNRNTPPPVGVADIAFVISQETFLTKTGEALGLATRQLGPDGANVLVFPMGSQRFQRLIGIIRALETLEPGHVGQLPDHTLEHPVVERGEQGLYWLYTNIFAGVSFQVKIRLSDSALIELITPFLKDIENKQGATTDKIWDFPDMDKGNA